MMKIRTFAALALLAGVAGCSTSGQQDPDLSQRHPMGADMAEANYPDGAITPLPRHHGVVEQVQFPEWKTSPRQREAERKTIARGMPHASIVP